MSVDGVLYSSVFRPHEIPIMRDAKQRSSGSYETACDIYRLQCELGDVEIREEFIWLIYMSA